MRITIAGYGFVGKAMEAYFKRSKTQINMFEDQIESTHPSPSDCTLKRKFGSFL